MSINETVEKVVLTDLRERQRIHKNRPINLPRLYQRITSDRYKIDKDGTAHKVYNAKNINKDEFYQFFNLLADLDLGKLVTGPRGGIKAFKSSIPINELESKIAYAETPTSDPVIQEIESVRANLHDKSAILRVLVSFNFKGKACKAEVPIEVLRDFEKAVGL